MADYYPLIARAVAGLDKNTGENRRALYERARTALVTQLRGVEPALDESDITRERLALEEAIRKVEAEAAKRTRPDDDRGAGAAGRRRCATRACAASATRWPRPRASAMRRPRPIVRRTRSTRRCPASIRTAGVERAAGRALLRAAGRRAAEPPPSGAAMQSDARRRAARRAWPPPPPPRR